MIPLVYNLRKEVSFAERQDSWIVFCLTPLNILRVGPRAHSILHLCNGSKSVHEMALEAGLAEESVFALCEHFRKRAILTLLPAENDAFFPFVSVVIPTRNRAADLVACLRSVLAQDYPQEDMEVIVVDDGSDENIADQVRSFPCKLMTNPANRGVSFARNRGASEAKGEILAFLDSDCVAGKAWLRDLVVYFQWEQAGAVGGFVDGYAETSALSRYEKAFSPLNLGSHVICSGKDSRFYLPTCNLLVRKDVFDQAGGMKERMHLGEDVDLCWRIRDSKHQMFYIPAGIVKHKHRLALGTMLKRRYEYGTSEALLHKLHPERKKVFQAPIAPATGFLALCCAIACASLFPLLVPLACIAFGSARKMVRIHRAGLSISSLRILLSVFRTHAFFMYFASFYILRYHLILLLLLGVFFPSFRLFSCFVVLVAGSADYAVKRPRLTFPAFVFYYVLDHIAYQTGVFVGCFRNRSFGTYFPRFIRK